MKKNLILTIAATLLLTPQPESRADFGDFMAGLFGVGVCAAVVGAVGSAAYHLCTPLSDQEEISRAKKLYTQAKSTYKKQSNKYQKPLSIHFSEIYTHVASKQYFRHIISTSSYFSEFPFLDYARSLNSSITRVNNKIRNIESKRNQLRKRKKQLRDNRKLTSNERFSYEQDYDCFSDKLLRIKRKLSDLHSNLKNLHRTVLSLNGYREDLRKKEEKERIEKLERKIEKLRKELRDAKREIREHQYNSHCTYLQDRINKLEKEKNTFSVSAWIDL